MKRDYLLAALCFVPVAVLIWFVPVWLGTPVERAWILRFALWVLGAAGGLLILYFRSLKPGAPNPAANAPDKGVEDLIRAANARLASSRLPGRGRRSLAGLPVVLFIGEPETAKTSCILRSGIDPELIAGQLYAGDALAPTETANLWISGGVVIAEAGGRLTSDAASFRALVAGLRARGLANLVGQSAQAPRSVVLCCDCSRLSARNAKWVKTAGRNFQTLLGEIAQAWGSRVPVYVLFTKLDQITYFADYVRHLSTEEAASPFGVCLPLETATGTEPYGDWQSRRLTAAVDSLFFGLADHRPQCLAAENDSGKISGVYEFPREFRKIRDLAVQFLVEVGRPSHLRASPFLRGFYFSGVRPVTVEARDEVADDAAAPDPGAGDMGATRIFAPDPQMRSRAALPSVPQRRRVPEWIFLRDLFANVLLADSPARQASASNTQAGITRRLIAGAAIGVLLTWAVGAVVSRIRNGGLIDRAAAAAASLDSLRPAAGQPSADALRQLEIVRESAALATQFERHSPYMSYRWGVYPGISLYEKTRSLYCREADRVLFAPLRNSVAAGLAGLPLAPGPASEYEAPFASLRAYLMMTSYSPQTDPAFLERFLTARWAAGRSPSQEEQDLAARQFRFYASERAANLCAANPDAGAVQRARGYLWRFQPLVRIYDGIIRDAEQGGPPFRFTDPAGAVIARETVPFVYTRAGWPGVQSRIDNSSRYYNRDPWVLGERPPDVAGAGAGLQQQLRQHYVAQYARAWQSFLGAASIAPYANLEDAGRKLGGIAASQSSLLRMFCGVSINTAVEAPEIQKAFAPVQAIEPPATCETRPNDAATQAYITALGKVKFQVDALARKPDLADVSIDSTEARTAALATSSQNNLPRAAEDLLQAPLIGLDRLVQRSGPEALNRKGGKLCSDAAPLLRRFPFDPAARELFTQKAFDDFFSPEQGQLARFIEENLKGPAAKPQLSAEFQNFLKSAAAIQQAFYSTDRLHASLRFTITAARSEGIDSFTLQLGDRTLRGSGAGGERQEFVWNGENTPAVLRIASRGEQGQFPSLWNLLYDKPVKAAGSTREYEGQSSFAGQSNSRYVLRLQFSPEVLTRMSLRCVSKVAQ